MTFLNIIQNIQNIKYKLYDGIKLNSQDLRIILMKIKRIFLSFLNLKKNDTKFF